MLSPMLCGGKLPNKYIHFHWKWDQSCETRPAFRTFGFFFLHFNLYLFEKTKSFIPLIHSSNACNSQEGAKLNPGTEHTFRWQGQNLLSCDLLRPLPRQEAHTQDMFITLPKAHPNFVDAEITTKESCTLSSCCVVKLGPLCRLTGTGLRIVVQ